MRQKTPRTPLYQHFNMLVHVHDHSSWKIVAYRCVQMYCVYLVPVFVFECAFASNPHILTAIARWVMLVGADT